MYKGGGLCEKQVAQFGEYLPIAAELRQEARFVDDGHFGTGQGEFLDHFGSLR
jgi:hypothetical protein